MKREIKCSYCGSFLFVTEQESNGAAGSEAQRKGFIFKMPFLYSNVTTAFFCDKQCCKAWFEENVSKEDRDKGRKITDELRARKEEIVNGCVKGIQTLLPKISEMQEAAKEGKLKEYLQKQGKK